ncbi:MAG: biotin--[acetyl-CoA-carboxylase] ligase [Acidobacteriota bacterium]|nr:biotin--[acetyl-CoA-carboxylase] ligase [Acidobacteriota bacterium]MDH3528799.1 biotin--[acetyl-CoA-carboxylase] ligase [Acidobacteriota bacterium]
MKIHIESFESISSTNEEALRQASLGIHEGFCVVAEEQLEGRGREGRSWHSTKGDGLYFSIVLRPRIGPEFLPLITLMSAVAVYDTIRSLTGAVPDIKWPNDVLVEGKKIAGILAETGYGPERPAVVVGIGINLTSENLPDEVRANATSLRNICGRAAETSELLKTLTGFLRAGYETLNTKSDYKRILREWSARSSFAKDREIIVKLRDESFEGVTRGLDEYGSLLVEARDGRVRKLTAGDIESVRPL